jgi:anti-sigma B factor antagonist
MQSTLSGPPVEVVHISGHLNGSNTSALQGQLNAAVAANPSIPLLIDMSQVESLDSAGLMAFVSALSLAQQLDRPLSLCAIAPSVRIIFELTQLDRVFRIFDDRAAFEVALH